MLHMTTSSTGYIENVWVWVADHDLDSGPAQTQIDIYVARGKNFRVNFLTILNFCFRDIDREHWSFMVLRNSLGARDALSVPDIRR